MKKIVNFISKNKMLVMFLFFVISMSCFLMCFARKESDYFWHIKAGEYIFHNGILKKDIFSWSVNGKYWMSHEWYLLVYYYYLFSFHKKKSF